MTNSDTLYCYIHPNRETTLRCNRCERPICAECAVRTPTGYRCKNCVREQQKIFDTAQWYDYVVAFFTGAILSGIASVLVILISSFIWGIIVIAIGPLAGAAIGGLARRFVKGHHSRWLNLTFGASIVIGALPVLLLSGVGGLLVMFASGSQSFASIFSLGPALWQIVYLVTAVPTAYSQFSGLLFNR